MTDQYTITPPPELRRLWAQQAQRMDPRDPIAWQEHIANQAARWGADTELDACLLWVGDGRRENLSQVIALRAARRPKPPSLKEQALNTLDEMSNCMGAGFIPKRSDLDTIRRALEAPPE